MEAFARVNLAHNAVPVLSRRALPFRSSVTVTPRSRTRRRQRSQCPHSGLKGCPPFTSTEQVPEVALRPSVGHFRVLPSPRNLQSRPV